MENRVLHPNTKIRALTRTGGVTTGADTSLDSHFQLITLCILLFPPIPQPEEISETYIKAPFGGGWISIEHVLCCAVKHNHFYYLEIVGCSLKAALSPGMCKQQFAIVQGWEWLLLSNIYSY